MIDNLTGSIRHYKQKAQTLRKYAKPFAEAKVSVATKKYIERCLECTEYNEQLAAWFTELAERREADRWIPVTERLPEDTEDVLVYDGQDMFVAWCGSYNRWHSSDDKLDKNTPITHWRPLPKAPERENDNG